MGDFNPEVGKQYRDKNSQKVFEVDEINGDEIIISRVDTNNIQHRSSREMLRKCYEPV